MKKLKCPKAALIALCTALTFGCSNISTSSPESNAQNQDQQQELTPETTDSQFTLSNNEIVFETPDEIQTLKAFYNGEEVSVNWTIGDKYIALLDSEKGSVRALSGGSTTITATLKSDTSKVVTGVITVNETNREATVDPFDAKTVTGDIEIITCGDSIMRDYAAASSDQYGLGQAISQFFDSSKVTVNTSISNGGRSSRKFYNESSRWPKVKTILEENKAAGKKTIVLLSFGHNDERTRDGGDAAIDEYGASFTFADTNQNGTIAGTFYDYMERYVVEARELGAVPVLVSPFVRAYIGSDGKITQKGRHNLQTALSGETKERGDYAKAMEAVALKHNAIYVDLTSLSAESVERYNDLGMLKYYYVDGDSTHERTLGGLELGKIVTQNLKEQGYLTSYIKEGDSRLMIDASSLAFGRLLSNASKTLSFKLSAFNLTSGTATITAPEGYEVSTAEDGEYASSINISTDSDFIGTEVYVKFTPLEVVSYNGNLTVTHTSVTPDFGNTPAGSIEGSALQIALTGSGKEKSTTGSAVTVTWPMAVTESNVVKYNATGSSTSEDLTPRSAKLSGLVSTSSKNGIARVTIDTTGNTWPVNDTGVKMDDVYIEYAIPVEGMNLTVNKISFDAGSSGGSYMRWSAYYTTDANFTNPDPICEIAGEGQTKDTTATFTIGGATGSDEALGMPVNDGETIYLRIYPANKGTSEATGKQLMIANVTIEGLLN